MRTCRVTVFCALLLNGCDGPQSALNPAGDGAQQVADLFYAMVVGATLIWLIVVGLAVWAMLSERAFHRRTVSILVIGGGAVFPTLVLTALLCYGLRMIPELNSPAPSGAIAVDVAGVRWWWRVTYRDEAAAAEFELANELVLPVGRPVNFKLSSEDVIHAFWIPSLGGKVDMIPGRETHLKLIPNREGIYRGVCAEYCGESHAHMHFIVKVVSEAEYEQWLDRQRTPAAADSELAENGLALFLQRGCSACHTIRGTEAEGTIGPDLTHVGSRESLAAGLLPNELPQLHRWLIETETLKPGVEMPQFDALSTTEVDLLGRYLEQLK